MPHESHIYAKSSDMAKAKMCAYPKSDHALPHWKFVLRCFAKCPRINIPDQETYDQYYNLSPSIRFHIYQLIVRCTTHGRLPLADKVFFVSVNRILFQNNPQKYTLERASDDGENHFKFLYKFIYTRNSEVSISHSTCRNTGYKSLWQLSLNCV